MHARLGGSEALRAARTPTLSASQQTGSFGLNITPPELIGPSCAAARSLTDGNLFKLGGFCMWLKMQLQTAAAILG